MLTARDLNIKVLEGKGNVQKFSLSPLPTGFGFTLGNILRRVMLSSMPGAAVTQVNIKGVSHQFTANSGIKEDIVEVGLNLKGVRFKKFNESPVELKINKKGKGFVTAGDIDQSSDVEVVNKDHVIATLTDAKKEFSATLTVESGVGFSPVEERETDKVGVILVDAVFTPVSKVSYEVVPARVGREGGLDELVMEVSTDGTITAEEALETSATILRQFFAKIKDGPDDEVIEPEEPEQTEEESEESSVLIEELDLPTRTINALRKAKINSVNDLMNREFDELSAIKGLGEKSVEDIKKVIDKLGVK